MIVVGTHDRGAMYKLLMGGVSEEIIHKSRYPVLVIPTHKFIWPANGISSIISMCYAIAR